MLSCKLRHSTGQPLDLPIDIAINIFAYGSNMCTERLRARVASATPVTIGYVTHRQLAFHKRGRDGSAKANAFYTGRIDDRVWGVVFSLSRDQKPVLDELEGGYDVQQATVIGEHGAVPAAIYVARADVIDASLIPYSWYNDYIIQGALQHQLPSDYVRCLQRFKTVEDDEGRRTHRRI